MGGWLLGDQPGAPGHWKFPCPPPPAPAGRGAGDRAQSPGVSDLISPACVMKLLENLNRTRFRELLVGELVAVLGTAWKPRAPSTHLASAAHPWAVLSYLVI